MDTDKKEVRRMKLYRHSTGKTHYYPEYIPDGWEYIIRPDFTTFWRRIVD
jgi:hypothetical protein